MLDQLEAVGKLQKSGRIKGLDDWIDAAKTGATDPSELAHELREAIRQTQAKPDKVIHIGGDNRAPVRNGTTEKMKSFDMTAESKSGKVSDSVEVTGLDDPIYRAAQLNKPIEHAADKVAAPPARMRSLVATRSPSSSSSASQPRGAPSGVRGASIRRMAT